MSRTRLNLFIEHEHAKRLDELSAMKGLSKSSIIAAALASFLSPDSGDQREAAAALMDVILDQDLQAEACVPERADDQQDHRRRADRIGEPLGDRAVIIGGQHQEADQQPQHQHQVADRGEPLEQPVMRALVGRAEAAHAADGGSVTHGKRPYLRRMIAQKAMVRTIPRIGASVAQSRLMVSS